MFKEFEVYCNKLIIAEGQGGGTSISRSTGQKIKEVLSGSQSAQEVPKKFRHFVKTHQFQIIEDTLCVPAKSRETTSGQEWRIVAFIEDFADIIERFHNSGGKHVGITKTHQTISKEYSFLTRVAVGEYISHCPTCKARPRFNQREEYVEEERPQAQRVERDNFISAVTEGSIHSNDENDGDFSAPGNPLHSSTSAQQSESNDDSVASNQVQMKKLMQEIDALEERVEVMTMENQKLKDENERLKNIISAQKRTNVPSQQDPGHRCGLSLEYKTYQFELELGEVKRKLNSLCALKVDAEEVEDLKKKLSSKEQYCLSLERKIAEYEQEIDKEKSHPFVPKEDNASIPDSGQCKTQ